MDYSKFMIKFDEIDKSLDCFCKICGNLFESNKVGKVPTICYDKECKKVNHRENQKRYRDNNRDKINEQARNLKNGGERLTYIFNCKNCNKKVEGHVHHQIFCSVTCQKTHTKNARRASKWKKCKECDKVFCGRTAHQKTCSDECKEIRRRKKQAGYQANYILTEKGQIARKKDKKWKADWWKNLSKEERQIQYAKQAAHIVNRTPEQKEKAREYMRNYMNKRRKEDPLFALRGNMSAGINSALRVVNSTKSKSTFDLLDFTVEELKAHLELQFTDGMTWDNKGGKPYSHPNWENEWHIDHIIPVSAWNFESDSCPEFKMCWALGNLRPMWAKDNMRKGNKIPGVDYI
jgi:hypothetical protein